MFSATSCALSEPLNLSGAIKKRMVNNQSHSYHCHPEHNRGISPNVTITQSSLHIHRQFAGFLTVFAVRDDGTPSDPRMGS
jgi:hypothetical protein